jgi:hypothetical protein
MVALCSDSSLLRIVGGVWSRSIRSCVWVASTTFCPLYLRKDIIYYI